MKKIFFILCILAVTLTSCDTGHVIDFKLINASGHTVTFTSNPDDQHFWRLHPNGITIEQAKDSLLFVCDGLGSADLTEAKYLVYGDTITFTFDDGKQLVYTQEEGNGPFDFEGDRSVWETKRTNYLLMSWDGYGCLSYIITEEDYAQAKQETDIPNKK